MTDVVPTPAPSSADGPPPRPRRGRWALLAFALAALASSWNPLGAPFGLVVGIVAAILAIRTLRRAQHPRRIEAASLALSVVAVVASAVVILLTAGAVGVDLPGQPVVKGRTQAELDQVLSEAGTRTRARRERAVKELDALGGRDREATPMPSPTPRLGAGGKPDRDRR